MTPQPYCHEIWLDIPSICVAFTQMGGWEWVRSGVMAAAWRTGRVSCSLAHQIHVPWAQPDTDRVTRPHITSHYARVSRAWTTHHAARKSTTAAGHVQRVQE